MCARDHGILIRTARPGQGRKLPWSFCNDCGLFIFQEELTMKHNRILRSAAAFALSLALLSGCGGNSSQNGANEPDTAGSPAAAGEKEPEQKRRPLPPSSRRRGSLTAPLLPRRNRKKFRRLNRNPLWNLLPLPRRNPPRSRSLSRSRNLSRNRKVNR